VTILSLGKWWPHWPFSFSFSYYMQNSPRGWWWNHPVGISQNTQRNAKQTTTK